MIIQNHDIHFQSHRSLKEYSEINEQLTVATQNARLQFSRHETSAKSESNLSFVNNRNNEKKNEAIRHPLVKDVIEVFDGRVVDVKPLKK